MKNNKGFTLIELLVVIAIIGILSSIVLSSLTSARLEGQKSAVKSQLSGMRSQAELYYGTNGNKYSSSTVGVGPITCDTSGDDIFGTASENGLGNLINGILFSYADANPQCFVSKTNWSLSVTMPGGGNWCVDNTGKSSENTMDTNAPYSCL